MTVVTGELRDGVSEGGSILNTYSLDAADAGEPCRERACDGTSNLALTGVLDRGPTGERGRDVVEDRGPDGSLSLRDEEELYS